MRHMLSRTRDAALLAALAPAIVVGCTLAALAPAIVVGCTLAGVAVGATLVAVSVVVVFRPTDRGTDADLGGAR